MKLRRSGFTLVEIAIFLAITGLLFAGIAVGTSNSIRQQRFTDSVQNFAEFLRSVYSEVSNPQVVNDGRDNWGRSDKAIYGKLIVFGEDRTPDGSPNDDNKIYVYSVLGDVSGDFGSGGINEALYNLGANVIVKNGDKYETVGVVQSYLPKWAAKIEPTDNSNPIETAVLIIRHPHSGTINTLVTKSGNIEVNNIIHLANQGSTTNVNAMLDLFKNKSFAVQEMDFCVDPNENFNQRQNVRIVANAHNAAGVEIISLDGSENRCRK